MTDRYILAAEPYTKAQKKKLKRFCGVTGTTIAKFVAEALDNEIQARIDSLPPVERDAVLKILSK